MHYKVVILLQNNQMEEDVIDAIKLHKYTVIRMPVYYKSDHLRNIIRMSRVLLGVKPEILFVSIGNFGNFLEALLFKIKTAYVMHVYPPGKTFRWKTRAIMNVSRTFLGKEKILVTVSDYAKERIIECWLGEVGRLGIQVIGNTVHNGSVNIKDYKKKIKKSFCVLTIGHVSWTKNSREWINVAEKVVKEMKNCTVNFLWLGDGPEYENCLKIVFERRLKNIHFLGYQSDTSDYYRNADVYFQPSNMESQGIAVLEAMMYGIPCVVSNIGGLPESVIDGENGYVVDVADSRKMADRIISLLKNDEKRRRYGKNGQEKFIALHAYDRWCEKMNELHDRLIG